MIENRKPHILIVDDTLQNIQVLGTILREQGYQLNVAQDGVQALKQVAKVIPDLILLDIMMPKMDGFETCRRLKEHSKTREIPVIFLTAKVETDDLVKGFELGAVDYITKPFQATELLKRVQTHLELALLRKDLEQRVTERTEELRQAHVQVEREHEERLERERQLAQAQKLEAIGQLTAGIGHEFNSPLQFISSNIEFLTDIFGELRDALQHYARLMEHCKDDSLTAVLLQEIDEALGEIDFAYIVEEIPRALEKAKGGISRVSRIVQAMKDISQPGTQGKVEVDLNEIVESATIVSRNEWKDAADLEFIRNDSLPKVPCLPGEFSQAIVHLMVNAAQAIAAKGSEKGLIAVTMLLDGDRVEVRVADTGTGIPEAIRSKIFDPFFTTREVGKGTGTGLSVARDVIVNKLGGEITIETEIGKGTTFVVRLPLQEE